MKFKVILRKEDEGGYSVTVPALEGCFSQGETWEKAIENAKEAIECHIESLKKDGEPVPRDEDFYMNELEVTGGISTIRGEVT